MKRREFHCARRWSGYLAFCVRARQLSMAVIGFLSSTSPEVYAIRLRAFGEG
jgi:hypothetical protein